MHDSTQGPLSIPVLPCFSDSESSPTRRQDTRHNLDIYTHVHIQYPSTRLYTYIYKYIETPPALRLSRVNRGERMRIPLRSLDLPPALPLPYISMSSSMCFTSPSPFTRYVHVRLAILPFHPSTLPHFHLSSLRPCILPVVTTNTQYQLEAKAKEPIDTPQSTHHQS